jgi:hypothetical protein
MLYFYGKQEKGYTIIQRSQEDGLMLQICCTVNTMQENDKVFHAQIDICNNVNWCSSEQL